MRKAIVTAILLSLFVLGAASAALATTTSGTIYAMEIDAEQHTLTFSAGAPGACGIGFGKWLINTDTLQGQTMANAVIAAAQSMKTVSIVGSGAPCNLTYQELVVKISQ